MAGCYGSILGAARNFVAALTDISEAQSGLTWFLLTSLTSGKTTIEISADQEDEKFFWRFY